MQQETLSTDSSQWTNVVTINAQIQMALLRQFRRAIYFNCMLSWERKGMYICISMAHLLYFRGIINARSYVTLVLYVRVPVQTICSCVTIEKQFNL